MSNMSPWSPNCTHKHPRRLAPTSKNVSYLSALASHSSDHLPLPMLPCLPADGIWNSCPSFPTHCWVKAHSFCGCALNTKSRSRNSKPGYVSRKESCPSHREKDMRHCLLKSPACAPKDNSCYQDGTSDGAYYEIGGTRTCDKGSWEESHVSQLLSLPQEKDR